MNILQQLGIEAKLDDIDLHMTPADTYGLFECRGDMYRVRSKKERYYYFYIDNWSKPPTLCFMERGIRHARVLALINAPQAMIDNCITSQGRTYKENSYAIDDTIRSWLKKNILTGSGASRIYPVKRNRNRELPGNELPEISASELKHAPILLPSQGRVIHESEIQAIIREYDLFEIRYNSTGKFKTLLRSAAENGTAIDLATGLRWQFSGSDISSFRQLQTWVHMLNEGKFAGFEDWRLPTIEEALSLLAREKGKHGSYIHPCFETKQGYIYTADRRKPGGYWFVDFRQARVFWASGSFAGGFGRLCRTEFTHETILKS